MVAIEQRPLPAAPQVGIPVHCHHIGKVARRDADAPGVPIEKPDVAALFVLGHEDVPDMRVAVDERDVAMGMVAREQARRRVEHAPVEMAPFA